MASDMQINEQEPGIIIIIIYSRVRVGGWMAGSWVSYGNSFLYGTEAYLISRADNRIAVTVVVIEKPF